MGHFAKVVDRIVTQVIVAEPEFFDVFVDTTPGKWVQCSYNTRGGVHKLGGTPLRKNYPGPGFIYDDQLDAFYEPRPYPSWTLNDSTYLWEPPTALPDNINMWEWNEQTLSWEKITE
jgi:hypothetical protein